MIRATTLIAAAFALPVAAQAAPLAVIYKTLSGTKANRYEYSVRYPVFAETSPVARLANRSLRDYAVKEVATFLKNERDTWNEFRAAEAQKAKPEPGTLFALDIAPVVSVATPDIISVYFGQYSHQGGAHPNTWYPSQTFGTVNGAAKKLAIADLFAPRTDPYKALSVLAIPELRRRDASSVTGTDPYITALTPDVLQNWVVTPSGITLLFSPYEVASYAEGAFFVKVKYADLRPSLNRNGVLKPFITVP